MRELMSTRRNGRLDGLVQIQREGMVAAWLCPSTVPIYCFLEDAIRCLYLTLSPEKPFTRTYISP
jgi:hypothetical protein